MQIQINAADMPLSDAVMKHVHTEVEGALHVFEDRVTRVEVHLNDVNSHKGGVDKRCLMEVRLAGQQPLVVEHQSGDMYEAIKLAAGKLERVVRRKVERLRER